MQAIQKHKFTFINQSNAIKRLLVGEPPIDLIKGEFVLCNLIAENNIKLYIACPQCGVCSFISAHQVDVCEDRISSSPNITLSCCNWHGQLILNAFIKS